MKLESHIEDKLSQGERNSFKQEKHELKLL